jgi:hypothetical protein
LARKNYLSAVILFINVILQGVNRHFALKFGSLTSKLEMPAHWQKILVMGILLWSIFGRSGYSLLDGCVCLGPNTHKNIIGSVITYLLSPYRSIALTAKQAITFQEISGGMLGLRIDAGATPQYATQWWHPFGIDYPENGKRASILNECFHVLKMLPETTKYLQHYHHS